MGMRIGILVGYWLYAIAVFLLSIVFIKNAPEGCVEGRRIFASGCNMLTIGFGILLTLMCIFVENGG